MVPAGRFQDRYGPRPVIALGGILAGLGSRAILEDEEIMDAMRFLHEKEDLTVEGAAAMPAAVVLEDPERFTGRRVALIVSGGRVDETTLARVLGGNLGKHA